MLNLSKITLLLLASIGLTACGALGTLLNEIENAGDECPLSEEFCELNEDGEQILLPDPVNVNATDFTISSSIRGEIGTKSGVLVNISEPADSPSYDVNYTEVLREDSGNGATDGFAYYSLESATEGVDPLLYVGILSTTDLGDAFNYSLSSGSEAKATWQATIVLISEGTPQTVDFPLEVNFNSREIKGENIEFAPVPVGPGIDDESRTGTLEGKFRVAGESNAGQMNGTFDIAEDSLIRAPMIGLIGDEGAVGVFSGGYFGGFVASP